MQWRLRALRRPALGAAAGLVAGITTLSCVLVGNVHADPADDALAKLSELSRQAEQTTEAMHTAQLNLEEKLAAQQAADNAHAADQAALDTAREQLTTYRAAVNRFAATTYMGGRVGGADAILTAESPQQLIDKLGVQRVVAGDMSVQLDRFRVANEQADQAEQASAKSADDARTAAEQAAAVRAELQARQSRLQLQISVVKSQYYALTPEQRTAMAGPEAAPAPEAEPGAPAPEGAPPAPGFPGFPMPWAAAPSPMDAGGGGAAATAVQAALTQVGTPYVWGGAAPGGFDCSGLVMWAFHQAGINLPHSSQAQANGGQAVSLSDLQPGDVLTFYSDASHSGIYVGDGMMIHSSTYGQPVRVVPMNSSGPIHNARRY
ncbi:peptidoglycan hydrolase RipC [Mycolicibacter arupensis]|uniref:Endopeptidase n=1 Tax=Mycolicibacter arupensis TaxID=342002 RepID=A0A0F5MVM4_9MYCO|nr:peptidoglycan hydrolase RipC [Mycolicibacter arupensis]KAA1432079.1 NlpC/P60 family protein [Mycolicibacter arupensis]KKB98726.1 endopeptidase [Mycolicibacter arupensis]MCV7276692.1 C40 family peptidase [Mycolicibacter arupensis]OQZ95106.1 endopeptidase [Mycolicibacter arupensis]TXI59483.1 MAG: NlpC/P60 family protein [Mycolicibacter arupensis]